MAQIATCALRESKAFGAHYMIVEYPMFGMAQGQPSEVLVNALAEQVYRFVVDTLRVPPCRIVLVGRSIGTGPACYLASRLEQTGMQ